MPMNRRALPRPGFARISCAALLLASALITLLAPGTASAQNCWVGSQPLMEFGDVGPSGKDISSNLAFTCNNWTSTPVAIRLCLSAPDSTPISGINPRWMTNNNHNNQDARMAYGVYSDPARTQILGPEGSGYPIYSTTLLIPTNGEGSGTMTVYGRVHAGQNLPPHQFQSHIHNARLRFVYNGNSSTPPGPEQCLSGGSNSGVVEGIYIGVRANFVNACFIGTATDLDFGNVSILDDSRDQTSTIQLQCPIGTVWRVGLNEGSHASGGVRRMAGPGGEHVRYELYRDSARNQRWGNAVGTDTSDGTGTGGTQSLTVYGRVPAQETPAAGTYSDTVTVTLTF